VILAGQELQLAGLPAPDGTISRRYNFRRRMPKRRITPSFIAANLTCAKPATLFGHPRMGKGAVWINGHALGRFWNLGPEQTVYVPAPWLRKGINEVVVFAQDQPSPIVFVD